MVSKQRLKSELWQRICRCEARGDWRGVEIYTATWHRVNNEPEQNYSVSGLARRMAADVAPIALDERIGRR